MNKCYVIFSLIFIFIAQALPLGFITATTIAEANSGPSIYFLEESWDFGEIPPDELPTHIFKFENIGDEVLIIKGTKVACESCIDPIISPKELNPGEIGELKITVNSMDMIGRFTKRIYVETNDPINPQAVIVVSGFIRPKAPSQTQTQFQSQTQSQSQSQSQPQTPFRMGISYFSQGEYDKAITEFEKSIELDPNHTESYYYLGRCYLQKGIIEYNNKNIFKAYSLYRKANEIAERVIPQYEKIIAEDPTDLDSYLKLGYIYEIRSLVPFNNEYDKALDYYLKALDIIDLLENNSSLTSSTSSIRYNYRGTRISLNFKVGYLYFEKKKYSQAIEYLEKVEKISPLNIEVNYYLGLSYDKIGEKEEAQKFLSRVIELAPQSEYAREAEKKLKKINKD
ncbi:MAG TPA: hypothetical protein DEG96_02640 [Candidatus Atribacteria bacterium]|nr:hypothetical protein [Candidatus Atribacteria bacterium]